MFAMSVLVALVAQTEGFVGWNIKKKSHKFHERGLKMIDVSNLPVDASSIDFGTSKSTMRYFKPSIYLNNSSKLLFNQSNDYIFPQ